MFLRGDTMTAEFSNDGEALVGVPQQDREWLRQTQTVPSGWAIWIGRRRMTTEAYRRVHAAFPILDAAELPAVIDEKARSSNS